MNIASILLVSSCGYALIIFISLLSTSIVIAEYDCSAKDDGWYYDPEFCHIYWRCTHGSAEEFECDSGTAWDHHANRCNWIDSVDCSRAETTTKKISSEEDEETVDDEETTDDDDTSVVIVSKPKKKKKKTNSNKRTTDENGDEIDRENLLRI